MIVICSEYHRDRAGDMEEGGSIEELRRACSYLMYDHWYEFAKIR